MSSIRYRIVSSISRRMSDQAIVVSGSEDDHPAAVIGSRWPPWLSTGSELIRTAESIAGVGTGWAHMGHGHECAVGGWTVGGVTGHPFVGQWGHSFVGQWGQPCGHGGLHGGPPGFGHEGGEPACCGTCQPLGTTPFDPIRSDSGDR